jgi:hypothetical protein
MVSVQTHEGKSATENKSRCISVVGRDDYALHLIFNKLTYSLSQQSTFNDQRIPAVELEASKRSEARRTDQWGRCTCSNRCGYAGGLSQAFGGSSPGQGHVLTAAPRVAHGSTCGHGPASTVLHLSPRHE